MFRTRAGDYRTPFDSGMGSSHADALLQERIAAIKKDVLEGGYIKRTAFLGRFYEHNLHGQHSQEEAKASWWSLAAIYRITVRPEGNSSLPVSPEPSADADTPAAPRPSNSSEPSMSGDSSAPPAPPAPPASPAPLHDRNTETALPSDGDGKPSSPQDDPSVPAKDVDVMPPDTHYLPVPPDQYVVFRMEKALKFYKDRIPLCDRAHLNAQYLTAAGSVASILLSALGPTEWTVLTAICVAGVYSWLEFQDTVNKLERYSSVVHALQNHVMWWKTRPPIDHFSVENMDYLVIHTEEMLMNELAAWRFSSAASKKLLESKILEVKADASGKKEVVP